MVDIHNVIQAIRNFLFSKANREFLIFLFFLALSGVFWLLTTLNETYEQEVVVPIHITNVPTDIMLTNDDAETVKAVIRDRGIVLLAYIYGEDLKHVEVDFNNYNQGDGIGILSTNDLSKVIQQHLSGSSKVVSVKPEKLKYYYNSGTFKKVPVHWTGRVTPDLLCFISDSRCSPDSVTVYATQEQLDSIYFVNTEPLNYVGFRDTLTVDCRLRKYEGVKIVPDQVTATFYTDMLTEGSTKNIPIQGVNVPKGKVLRTFPAKVEVKYVIGVNAYKDIKPSDFSVLVDYDSLRNNPSEKCSLILDEVPRGVTRAVLVTKQVDYLIEDE